MHKVVAELAILINYLDFFRKILIILQVWFYAYMQIIDRNITIYDVIVSTSDENR